MSNNLEPTTIEIGPDIPGIERHEKQESCYTLCAQQDDISNFRNARFVSMEEDINKSGFYVDSNGNDVDLSSVRNVTCKFTIPVSERNKVLKKLQKMNINRCFLFEESEDNRLSDSAFVHKRFESFEVIQQPQLLYFSEERRSYYVRHRVVIETLCFAVKIVQFN